MIAKLARRLALIACVALGVSSCGSTAPEIWRYELTLSLDTPGGVVTGSSVVEKTAAMNNFLGSRNYTHGTTGQAIVLDLGAGRPALVALVGSAYGHQGPWRPEGPSRIFERVCPALAKLGYPEWHRQVRKCTTPIKLSPDDLPTLLAFTNPADPGTAELVDPRRLGTTIGAGVAWRSMTLQVTSKQVTGGIGRRMPWAEKTFLEKYFPAFATSTVNVHPVVRDAAGQVLPTGPSGTYPRGVYLTKNFFDSFKDGF